MLLTSQFTAKFNPNNYSALLMPQRVWQQQHIYLPLFCHNVLFPTVKRGYLTLVVLILLPAQHIQPELSGSVLHSSPSRQGSISHHHFPITMDATGNKDKRNGDAGSFLPNRAQNQIAQPCSFQIDGYQAGVSNPNYQTFHVKGGSK